MQKFSLGMQAPINGIYLNSETIELLSIVQCNNIDELRKFARNCSQLNISEKEIESWNESDLESIKSNLVEQYKESLIPMEQSIKDRRTVLEAILMHSGLPSDEIDSYTLVFQTDGYEGIKQKLKTEHPESYAKFTEKAHRYISTERDQIKSLTYEELTEINDVLPKYNTVLVASGRYYDVTKKMYDEQVPNMEKYDFYYAQRGLDFCYRNGMYARYHTLLDKQTMEEHLIGKSKKEVLKELQEYVKKSIDFISEYNEEHKIDGKGVITSVDLFNEIISFNPPYRNMWEEIYGISNEELVGIFQYALENKPKGITFVYNEPFLENPERREAVLEQLKQINSLCPGLIDTIGTQMHIEMTQSPKDIRKCFEDLKNTEVNIQITEFDMCLPERFMFDQNGKVRSESEILNLIKQKTGMTFKSIAELKEMRINEISKAIEETGVSLEGITYWSISDTLDHNLERTNRKTFEQGLERDIATTRYAGLYSYFSKEKEVSDREDKTKKNRLFGFISKIINKIKSTTKRKDVKMLPKATQVIREKSSPKSNSRNELIERLRFESTNNEQNPFPSDEDIVKNMNINEKFYSFNMEDIDKKIRIPKLTKNGEQLFLYRKNIKSKQLGAINYKIQSVYYIINKSGKIVGRVPISISDPTSLSMDYWIKDEFQGQGIGSVVLEEIVRQIYNEKAFNGIDFKASKFPETDKTAIQNIQLEISDDNDASIRIATKNGFNKIGERSYSLTLKDFLDMNQERKEI